MAEKLSWTELRRALADRAGVNEKTANTFLTAFTAQLMQGLKTDKQVKINGFGTFKLQGVAPRKSVNVSTGEEIIIEGYNKVVFTPEVGVKELVEKGQVTPDTPIDPLKKLGEQATEIVDLLTDLGQSPTKEKKKRAQKKVEPEPIVEEPAPVVEEPVVEEPVVEEPAPEVSPDETGETLDGKGQVEEPVEEEPVFIPEPVKPQEPTGPHKPKNHFLRDLLICVVVLLMLLIGGYFFLRSQLSAIIESFLQPKPQTEQVEPAAPAPEETAVPEDTAATVEEPQPSTQLDLIPEGEIPQEQILDEFLAISGEMEMEDDSPYPNLITTEEMHAGSRLTWMAKRFYGDKKYWPYLYDANRDVIDNPSKIEVGTPIRVPRLTAEQLDTTNAETRANLERLRIEAEEACKR